MTYTLKPAELQIIQEGLQGPESLDWFCQYWYGKDKDTYFRFDYNFDPQYAWQKKLVFAQQTLIVGVMGIGSGKTLGVGMAGTTWALSTEGFKFMNGCNWAYQSRLMKDLIVGQLVDTPAYNLIDTDVDTPYPKLIFRFKVGGMKIESSMEFMSMDKQAAKIFSWRGDWINLDEAALVEQLDVALMNLSTRLTGRTARGREFLGRMSLMSNPWDNDSATHLYYFYDLAIDNPEECLSISIPTRANKNVSDRQVKNATKFIPDKEEQERLLEGVRPEGKGKYFAKGRVEACADNYLTEWLKMQAEKGEQGFNFIQAPTLGMVEFETPADPNGMYFITGDPGTSGFPARNAPCIAVIDARGLATHEPAVLRAFWWGNGNGRIQPFVDKLYEWRSKYRPIVVGVDSTGPQKGMVEILNLQNIWNGQPVAYQGFSPIVGMDFSIGRKFNMLVSLRNMIELGLLRWPDGAKGIKLQLFHYDPLMDRGGEPKIAQDIVATLAMGAFILRAYYPLVMETEPPDRDGNFERLSTIARNLRSPREARTLRR